MASVVPVQKRDNSQLYSLVGSAAGNAIAPGVGGMVGGMVGSKAGGLNSAAPVPNAQTQTQIPQQTAENPQNMADAMIRKLQMMQQQQAMA